MKKKLTAKSASSGLQKFSFYTSREYYADLAQKIDQTEAGGRVVLVSLWLEPEHSIQNILKATQAAAKRGIKVLVMVDAYTLLIKRGLFFGPAFLFGSSPPYLSETFRKRTAALEELRQAGAECVIIHQPDRPLANPFRGRSHMKFSVVDDEVFIGGCNLAMVDWVDIMVSWNDKRTADWLRDFASAVADKGRTPLALDGKDQRIAVDAQTTLLVDAGKPGKSVILDEAIALIDRAEKSLFMTHQYFPHGVVADHLEMAHNRGVTLKIVHNHTAKHHPGLSTLYGITYWRTRQRKPPSLFEGRLPKEHEYMHGKLLASEKEAMVGSHNYMPDGAKWGTAEVAMINHSPAFAKQAIATIVGQLQHQ